MVSAILFAPQSLATALNHLVTAIAVALAALIPTSVATGSRGPRRTAGYMEERAA